MSVRRISAREAHERLSEGYAYLDVRSVPEFDTGHPEGAYNVPLLFPSPDGTRENPGFLDEVARVFERHARIVVGCATGVRSLRAAELLTSQGYTDVFEQRAGMDGVRDAFGRTKERGYRGEGLPIATSALPGRSYEQIRAAKQ